MKISHWKKLDHVAFVLMLLTLSLAFATSIVYPSSIATPIFIVITIVLWIIALVYDILEETDSVKVAELK